MFGNKKEDNSSYSEGLPDLPPIESSEIPTFLTRSLQKKSQPDSLELPKLPDYPKSDLENTLPQIPKKPDNFKTIEMKEWAPESNELPRFEEISSELKSQIPDLEPSIPNISKINNSTINTSKQELNQDIFIKIEKFRSIRKTLRDTQDMLEEISSLLSKIRETKMREEQELVAWEKELAAARSRISNVNSDIFEKVK